MRSVRIVLLFTLLAAPATAEERTWTISTGTYAMAAELVEVRGDIAYLKTGDRIEHIPLVRLSAADMQYIAKLSSAAILPGPVDEQLPAAKLPAPANEFNALPPGGPILNPPVPPSQQTTLKPVTETSLLKPNPAGAAVQPARREEMLPVPRSAVQPRSQPRTTAPRTMNNPNARRTTAAQQQNQNRNQNTSAQQNRSRNDERYGLFGWRSRRSASDR